MSGLLIGILLARTFSGFVSEYFGWRTVYVVAAVLQVLLVVALRGLLPADEPRAVIHYPQAAYLHVAALADSQGAA